MKIQNIVEINNQKIKNLKEEIEIGLDSSFEKNHPEIQKREKEVEKLIKANQTNRKFL